MNRTLFLNIVLSCVTTGFGLASTPAAVVDMYSYSVSFCHPVMCSDDQVYQAIQSGADVHKKSGEVNALHEAATCQHNQALLLLLEKKVDCKAVTNRGATPLFCFLEQTRFDSNTVLIVSKFLESCPEAVNVKSKYLRNPYPLDLVIERVKDGICDGKEISPGSIEYQVIERLLAANGPITGYVAEELIRGICQSDYCTDERVKNSLRALYNFVTTFKRSQDLFKTYG